MRRILLADADAFYVAVARAVDPEGAGKAPLLIVGGSRDSRGVVCSASYETRKFGVRSAMPIARALPLCPDAVCVPVPFKACLQKSAEIRELLHRYSPIVEGASVDEWYLDLTGTEGVYRHEPLATTAQRIRAGIREATGLTLSIGGGTNKLIAKMAVDRAKPSRGGAGVLIVEPGAEDPFLRTCALGDIPLVGPKFQERLAAHGLVMVEDLLRHDLATLERWMIKRELLRLVTRAAADLRGDGLTARTVAVRLRDFDFRTQATQRTLPEPVVADRVILRVAHELLKKLRDDRRVPARLVGVRLSGLKPSTSADQLGMFTAETDRDRGLARAIDRVRGKFGPKSILPGGIS